jgi:putative serine protease PepD
VTFDDGTTERATVVGTSATNDLAVIKVAASDKLVPATFAESESLQVGQSVVAVGAPLGLSDTVTAASSPTPPVRSGRAPPMTRFTSPYRPTRRSTPATPVVRWST